MAGQPFRAGVGHPLGPNERFQVVPFSFPRLRLAHCKIERFCLVTLAPVNAGDLHRAYMAWAKHAARCGWTMEQIKDELLDGRDLSKKGSRKRQLEYASAPRAKR